MTTDKKTLISFRIDTPVLDQFRVEVERGQMSQLVQKFMESYISGEEVVEAHEEDAYERICAIIDKSVSRHHEIDESIIAKGQEWGVPKSKILNYILEKSETETGYVIGKATNKTWL